MSLVYDYLQIKKLNKMKGSIVQETPIPELPNLNGFFMFFNCNYFPQVCTSTGTHYGETIHTYIVSNYIFQSKKNLVHKIVLCSPFYIHIFNRKIKVVGASCVKDHAAFDTTSYLQSSKKLLSAVSDNTTVFCHADFDFSTKLFF